MTKRAEGAVAAHPLFQAEGGGSIPTSALQLRLFEVSMELAADLNRQWHSMCSARPFLLPHPEDGMIDTDKEAIISLATAGRMCARDGNPASPVTLWRWATHGCGPTKIKLETVRIGGRTCTSREAVQRFIAALNPAAPALPRTPAATRRAAD